MQPILKTGLAALMLLLAISCKKENNTIQSSLISDKSSTDALLTDIVEPDKIGSIKIGTQVWMKKDLTVSNYRNGDPIPQVKDLCEWVALTTGAWCWYYNKHGVAGKLYNWYAVNDPRGLAPAGWHVPSDAEWTTLTEFLGGDLVAGGKMKETGTSHWLAPNTDVTNSSGFTGLPGGFRYHSNGKFFFIGWYGYWWSSTESSTTYAWYRGLYYLYRNIYRAYNNKHDGNSVRCLRD